MNRVHSRLILSLFVIILLSSGGLPEPLASGDPPSVGIDATEETRSVRSSDTYTNDSWENIEFYRHRYETNLASDPSTGDLYFFGGTPMGIIEDGLTYEDDLWRYRRSVGEWKLVKDGGGPSSRGFVKMAIDGEGKKLYLYGGARYELSERWYDLWVFDIQTEVWTQLVADCDQMKIEELGYRNGWVYAFNYGNLFTPSKLLQYNITRGQWSIIDNSGNIYDYRRFFSSAFDPAHGRFYIVGGLLSSPFGTILNETWVLDVVTHTWTNLTSFPDEGRILTDLVYDEGSDKLYTYGGTTRTIDDWTYALGDLWEYDCTNDVWTRLQTAAKPDKEIEHQLGFDNVNDILYLYCVRFDAYRNDDEFWECSINTLTWRRHKEGDEPPPIGHHTFVATKDELIVFGGQDLRYPNRNMGLWSYNLTTGTWRRVDTSQFINDVPEIDPISACDNEGERLFVFSATGGQSSNLWMYEVDANWWTKMDEMNPGTRITRSCAAYSSSDDSIYIFGGYNYTTRQVTDGLWRFNVSQRSWSKIGSTGPGGRMNASLVFNEQVNGLYLFGGHDGNTALRDLWQFDIDQGIWKEITPSAGNIPPRELHEMMIVYKENLLMVYGGRDRWENHQDDVWIFYLDSNEWVRETPANGPGPRDSIDVCMAPDERFLYLLGGNRTDNRMWKLPLNSSWITVGPKDTQVSAKEDEHFSMDLWTRGNPVTESRFETNASWLKWDENAFNISGTPTNSDVGTSWASLNVSNGRGNFDELNVTITVENTPPMILTESVLNATEDQLYRVDYNCTDDGQGNITWGLTPITGDWLSLDPATGVLSGTPDDGDEGEMSIIMWVSDGNGGLDYETFTLTVVAVNDAPTILTVHLPDATEDEPYTVLMEVADPDTPINTLFWSIVQGPGFLTIDFKTGTLSGKPMNEDVGIHTVVLTVDDGEGGKDAVELELTVHNVNDPPIIESVGPHGTSLPIQIEMDEGEELRYTITASDEDGDEIIFAYESEWTGVEIEQDGTFHVEAPQGEDGTFLGTLIASDGNGGSHEVEFKFIVNDVNYPPTFVDPPLGVIEIHEDQPYTLQLEAVDKDGDVLTWLDDSDVFDIGETNGLISFTPGQEHVGIQEVKVTVVDGAGGLSDLSLTFSVLNVNDLPVIISVGPDNGTVFNKGENIAFVASATDDDGDPLVYTWKLGGETLGTGPEFMYKGLPKGEHVITLEVNDGNGITIQELSIKVEESESSPGFGLLIVVLALLASFALVRSRHDRSMN